MRRLVGQDLMRIGAVATERVGSRDRRRGFSSRVGEGHSLWVAASFRTFVMHRGCPTAEILGGRGEGDRQTIFKIETRAKHSLGSIQFAA